MNTEDLLVTDRAKIRKAWGKSDEDVYKDIEIVKDWLKTQPHLPELPNDNMIEFFLTNCKFSIEKTKQNLDMYYTIRDLMPDIYRGNNPCSSPDMDLVFNTGHYLLLPKLTPDLYRVFVTSFLDTDPEETDIRKANATYFATCYEIRIQEDLAMGDLFLADLKHLKFGTAAAMTPMLLKQYAFILEKVHSGRLKGAHLINVPGFMGTMLNIFKSFLSKKLKDRIIIHESLEDVFKYIPQDLLPSDYGGKEKSMKELTELWKEKYKTYKDRFDYLETIKVKEELRPEKLKNDEILGYHGNFKKLSVD